MDTKEKILLGMLDLIYEVGLEKASMGKLSQKINASPGNIYFYFEGKAELIDTLYEYCMLSLAEYLDQLKLMEVDMDTDAGICLKYVWDIVRKEVEFYQKNPKMLHFVITSKSSFYLSDDIKKGRYKRNKPIYHLLGILVKRKLIKPMEVEDVSTYTLGVLYEVLKESIMFENIVLDDEGIDKFTEIIWSGLKYREKGKSYKKHTN
ncbi:TetR/AcrR family transcriptional regulator [Sebaldella sp. S0638]|uniref:TetR/AcrR family transcriptional regulator n=1 Tax=Sebaldella sp. S0638 TaxID=2957809 RepID=UPI00209EE845|nr:TetR/AcrR family transcriptional regulator [Sebaldella sp. S0638]MCP1223520.1 TetR/AcrR family transcriptional regulator [Sebaldella sp. S0638]